MKDRIARALKASPYQGYAYSYPHKTAYRPLTPARAISGVWSRVERNAAAGLYVHVPFCEMRCGFCNLFTAANLPDDAVAAFMGALALEMETVAEEIGPLKLSSLTLGGGTPTYLGPRQLERLFDLLARWFNADSEALPVIVETSPKTATFDCLGVLAERGTDRISIGVQSFIEDETKAMGRPQSIADVTRALDAIRTRGFPKLNVDLIYGAAGQTVESWRYSLREALRWSPDEFFLYPLYVRPRTGLDARPQNWDDQRLSLYRAGRELLLAEGYTQVSMRMFKRSGDGVSGSAHGEAGALDEPLVGLGCGARSRTPGLHYSAPYAVGRAAVNAILREYCERKARDFATVSHGIELDRDAQIRRIVIKSLLNEDGLDLARFDAQFDASAHDCLPELSVLAELEMLDVNDGRMALTTAGLERADTIGPLLYAPDVSARMEAFELQ